MSGDRREGLVSWAARGSSPDGRESAAAIDRFMPQTSATSAADAGFVRDFPQRDRRRRARWQVQWPVMFPGEPGTVIETVTRDLSSDGFFCMTGTPFVPGEICFCILSVPANDPKNLTRMTPLHCRVRVIRVDVEDGLFGVACRIEDYQVQPSPADAGSIAQPEPAPPLSASPEPGSIERYD